jgi:putative PIN family toxin of toxin-antitoxin system
VLLAVVDTNVWVSAHLTPNGTPAKLLSAFAEGLLVPVYTPEIEVEYRAVLYRPKFAIGREELDAFMALLAETGRLIDPVKLDASGLPDPDDAPFIAAARTAACPIVTGNARHFPPESGAEAISPAVCLARLFTG